MSSIMGPNAPEFEFRLAEASTVHQVLPEEQNE